MSSCDHSWSLRRVVREQDRNGVWHTYKFWVCSKCDEPKMTID